MPGFELTPEIASLYLVSMGLGLTVETVAALLGIWAYKGQIAPILNVTVMFGMVQGLLIVGQVAPLAPPENIMPLLMLLGLLTGMLFEASNHFVLKTWYWTNESLWFMSSRLRQTVGIGAAWALVPPVIYALNQWVAG